MNRVPSLAFRVVLAAILFCSGRSRNECAGACCIGSAEQDAARPEPSKDQPAKDATKDEKGEDEGNPFAPQPAPTLPPGMTGSDVNDPRFKLTPGLYDAGEASHGHQARHAGQEARRVSARL